MNKALTYLLISAITLIACSNQPKRLAKSDLNLYNLKGNVRSVKTEIFQIEKFKDTFKIIGPDNGLGLEQNSLLEFNTYGNLKSLKVFKSNGNVSNEKSYEYNSRNRLIRRKEIDNYGRGSFMLWEFKYDSSDSLEQFTIDFGSNKRTAYIKRDDLHRPVKKEIHENDSIVYIYTVEYNDKNNVLVATEFRKPNQPFKIIRNSFNDKNLKEFEKIIEYGTYDTMSSLNKFYYNDNDQLIRTEMSQSGDSIYDEELREYFANGDLKSIITIFNDSDFYLKEIQAFNKQSDLIEQILKTSDSLTNDSWKYTWKYDSLNNWIEKTEFKNNKPLRLIKRQIQYY